MPEYCLSLLPQDFTRLEAFLSAGSEADLFELRLDYFREIDFRAVRRLTAKKLLVTFRLPAEGGHWAGTDSQRIPLLQAALDSGMDFIDVEWRSASRIVPRLRFTPEKQLVLSCHTAENYPEKLKDIFSEMRRTPAAVYKLIYTARNLNDNLTAPALIDMAKSRQADFVIHAMGEAGKLSRLLGALAGNRWTYVSPGETDATAEGQFTLAEIRQYYLAEKNPGIRLMGLAGYPVAQSSGWRLHNRLLHEKRRLKRLPSGAEFLYVNFPAPDFPAFLQAWRSRISGLSITIPHKETVLPYLDAHSPGVRKSGVCNTMLKKGGQWWGFNTDLHAIIGLLKPHRKRLRGGAVVYGTGGTARSAIAALQSLGVTDIFLAGRNAGRGGQLAEIFGIRYLPLSEIKKHSPGGIIQTTPVGMHPRSEALPEVAKLLRPEMVVMDVIYHPPLTRLLQMAREKNCEIISGEEMFLRQAALQFGIFSGLPVSAAEAKKVWRQLGREK